MGSRRQITLLFALLFVCKYSTKTHALPDNLHEERREFQYQRSSTVVGGSGIGSGYYNSQSGNYEQLNSDLDGWMHKNKDEVEGMAEKLRSEFNTALSNNGNRGYYQTSSRYTSNSASTSGGAAGCNRCAMLPGFTGKTQEELDIIAKDMTNQIIADMKSGKLMQNQVNQPNWFEHRVAQKLEELNKQHQTQYQQNLYSASSRYHQTLATQQPQYYSHVQNNYNKDTEDLQQTQQNVFNAEDLQQVQQNVFGQSQHQQQDGYYQQQSQNQYGIYTRPGSIYQHTQVTNEERERQSPPRGYVATDTQNYHKINEERVQTVYPTPIIFTNNVQTEKNCTTTSSVATPHLTSYNQYGMKQTEIEERDEGQLTQNIGQTQINIDTHDSEYTRRLAATTEIPQYENSYFSQRHETDQRTGYTPPQPGGSQTYQSTATRVEERERVLPIIIPTQHTIISSNQHVEEETRYQQPSQPVIRPIYDREYYWNRTSITRPTAQPTIVIQTSQQQSNVEVHTPKPVVVTSIKHSIYDHIDESEVVPNYKPRVVIDRNTEFQVLDHRREKEYRPAVSTITTEEEERLKTIENKQEHDTQHRLNIFNQLSNVTQHVLTVENDNSRIYNLSQYPSRTEYDQKTEYNETNRRYPSYPISSLLQTTHNSESNVMSLLPQKYHYVMNITEEEYIIRLRRIQEELRRLGYERLSQSEYNATIASGGFTHNGYKYLYNVNSGRYEKGERLPISNDEYQSFYRRLEQQLQQNAFAQMSEQEINQTITSGVFIRSGYKWTYNSETDRFAKDEISSVERQQIFSRIQEILKRLNFRQISQKECDKFLANGSIIRGGYQWIYNVQSGTVEKSDYIGDFAEFSQDEYEEIYKKIQETLQKLGYGQMTQRECNATITSGKFVRGGIVWNFNGETNQFERSDLSQSEYLNRLNILRSELIRIGYKELSVEEYREIIYRGYFYHGGYRYEYMTETGKFEKIDITDNEYRERLRRLQELLKSIGYGYMSEADYNSTITNGIFHYDGFEWLYNFETGNYEMGGKSKIVTNNNEAVNIGSSNNGSYYRRPHEIISKNRGDQPPQHFDEDYESEEILEQEPGIGYYPADKKPEIGLAPPNTYNQMQERTTPRSIPTYYSAPLAPYNSEKDQQNFEVQLTSQVWPTISQQSEYERRYHRTQTSYSRMDGAQPIQHISLDTVQKNTEEMPVYSTEAYRVGSEGYARAGNNVNFRRGYGADELLQKERAEYGTAQVNSQQSKNNSYSRGSSWNYSNRYNNNAKKFEDLESMQQTQALDAQHPEDLTQQLVDFGIQSADLNQQHFSGFNQHSDNTYSSQSKPKKYNSEYDAQHPEDLTQQLVDFGIQSGDLTQQHVSGFNQHRDNTYSSQSKPKKYNSEYDAQHPEDLTQQLVDFGIQSGDLTQQHVSGFNQHSDNTYSQSKLKNFNSEYDAQHPEDLTQQLIGLEKEELTQQQQQVFGYDKHNEKNQWHSSQSQFEHDHSKELTQQLVDMGQDIDDLTQKQQVSDYNQHRDKENWYTSQSKPQQYNNRHNSQHSEDFSQHMVATGQETEDLTQQTMSHYAQQNKREETLIEAKVEEIKPELPKKEEKSFWQRVKDKAKSIVG